MSFLVDLMDGVEINLSVPIIAASSACLTVGAFALWVRHHFDNDYLVRFISRHTPVVHSKVQPQKKLIKKRLEILTEDKGPLKILEIGSGIGNNFDILPEGCLLTVVEPLEEIRPVWEKNFAAEGIPRGIKLQEYLTCAGEHLPDVHSRSFDVVLMTYTLCSVQDVKQVMLEARRMLKDGGLLIAMDHTRSATFPVGLIQRCLDLVWKYFTGNCHLRRYPPDVLETGIFPEHEVIDFQVPNLRPLVRTQVLCFATK